MTDKRDDIQPDTEAEKDGRPDPRLRPPDPAGTQPKWDPEALLPKEPPPAAPGRLWARDPEGATEGEPMVAAATTEAAAAALSRGTATAGAVEPDRPTSSHYSGRFQFLLGALLACGAAAIALLVAAVVGDSQNGNTVTLRAGPAWSKWKPNIATGGADAAKQIADHVGHQYKLPNGQQLVAVTGGPMEIGNLPVTIAIQKPADQGGTIDFVDGVGVLYRLCGVGGKDCGIAYGKPSVNRHMLLQREALELALYSFRYLGVNQTVVLMPPSVRPTKGADGKAKPVKADPEALLFRRGDPAVMTALAHPLESTLAKKTPSVSTVARSPDAGTVKSLAQGHQFSFRFQQSNQDLRAFLVLNPMG